VTVEVDNGIVTWRVDGLLMATVDSSAMVLGGGNIFFGHSDINSTSSTDANDAALLFTLIDNIRVEGAAIPEPAAPALVGLAGLALLVRRHRGRATARSPRADQRRHFNV
jgi:hypothetical protein